MNNIECSTITSSLEIKDHGRVSINEAKKIIESFPWSVELEKTKDEEVAFAASVELYPKDLKGTSFQVMSFEKNSYLVDIEAKKSFYYLFILPKVTQISLEDITISEVFEYMENFFKMDFEQLLIHGLKQEKRNLKLKANWIQKTLAAFRIQLPRSFRK